MHLPATMNGSRAGVARATRLIEIAYTPDTDDIFNFLGWEEGHVAFDAHPVRFHRHHISFLNHAAAAELYDVVNVSAVMYPALADRYWILSTGSSVGRGYGPMLVGRDALTPAELSGKPVAVAERSTTGAVLAQMYCPGISLVQMPYDRIAEAVLRGETPAGVMIHEELVHYPQRGLNLILNLGRSWCDETGLPLPVGLTLVHRRVGLGAARAIQRACRESFEWGDHNRETAMKRLRTLCRGCADQFVPMFCNRDTHRMQRDVLDGLRLLCERVVAVGAAERVPDIEVIHA